MKAEARRRAALMGGSHVVFTCPCAHLHTIHQGPPPHSASRPELRFRNPVLLFLAICSLAVTSLTVLRTNMGGDKHRHMTGRQCRVCMCLHVCSKRCWGRKHGRYVRTQQADRLHGASSCGPSAPQFAQPSPLHGVPGAWCLFPFPRNVRQPEWPPALTFGLWLRVAELSVGAVPVAVLIRSRALQAVLRCWFGPQPLLGTALPGKFVCPQVLGGPDQVDCGLFEGAAKVLHGGLAKAALVICSVAVSGRLA